MRAAKLDGGLRSVNLAQLTLLLLAFSACGPSPRPVSPSFENAWPTTLGNARRAVYEHELIADTLSVAWDIDAGRGLRASVLLTDSTVFVATTNRQVLAFETRTGRRNWDQRLEGEIASDIVRSGRTIFMTTTEWNGRVHARDIERGRRVWQHDVGPARFSPLIEGGVVYVGTDRGYVHALHSETGDQLWRTRAGGSVAATPVSHRDALIVGTAGDTLVRVAKHDGAVQARGTIDNTISATPALSGDTLIVPTQAGMVLGIDARTLRPLWRVETGAPVLAAPIVGSDGIVHVLNRDAAIWRIENGRGTRVADLDGGATSSFTLVRDRYIIGLVNGTLLITDLNGAIVTQHQFNDSVAGPVAVRGGALYVPLLHGRVVKMQ